MADVVDVLIAFALAHVMTSAMDNAIGVVMGGVAEVTA